MRRYLSPALRKRFDLSWKMLPENVREELKHFIYSVRCAPSLKGIQFDLSDGKIAKCLDEASGWFVSDDRCSPQRGYIYIHSGYEEAPIEFAVATILHELANSCRIIGGLNAVPMCVQNWQHGFKLLPGLPVIPQIMKLP